MPNTKPVTRQLPDVDDISELPGPSSGAARWPPALAGIAAIGLALAAGYACSLLRTPIPWMVGPLFALALARTAGLPMAAPPGARQAGQWIIGTALGLYFTHKVVVQVAGFLPAMFVAALVAVAVGYVAGWVLSLVAGVDRPTAFFACVPGGAMEMAVLGERFGAKVDRVAVAQSVRILLVVSVIPWVYAALDVHGADRYLQASAEVRPWGLFALMACSFAGATLLQRLSLPNAWMLGSLFVVAPLTALEVDFSAMPVVLSNVGQLCIGCALGSRFEPDFLRSAPRYLLGMVASIAVAIVLSAIFGIGLAWAAGLHPATLVLATAPGGIAEMCITAKVLQLGVPIVTAFHVTRVIMLVTTSAPLFRLLGQVGQPRDGNAQ